MEAKSSDGGGVRLHVGGLGESVGRDDLIKIFSPMGKVEDVEFVRTKGRSFAYIDFSPSSTNSLTKLFSTYNGCIWKGGRLRLEKAKEHYMARLKREWEAASSTSDNTIKSPSDSTPSTHINIFFPRLRKVKAMPLSGTGKHKYSFQRVPVPSVLPKSFCDCEEHSKILNPQETHLHDLEALDVGINVDEVNVMKSVMNKLFQEHNIPTSEQVPEEDNEIEADQDDLIINVVSSRNDMGKELDLLSRKRKSILNETAPSVKEYNEGQKRSKKRQAISLDENGRQESSQAIREKKKLSEVIPDKPSDELNRTTGVKRSIDNISWSQKSSWKSLIANGNTSDFSVSSFLPGVGSSKAVQPALRSADLAGFPSQENSKEKKKSNRITSKIMAVDLPLPDDIEKEDSDNMTDGIERDDSDTVEDDIERDDFDAVEDDTASDSMADDIERDDSDTMADDIESVDSDAVEDDIERDDTDGVEDDTASDSMADDIERDDYDAMVDEVERDDSDAVEDDIERDDTDAVEDDIERDDTDAVKGDTGSDSMADDTANYSVADDADNDSDDPDNDSVADDAAIDAVGSEDSESLADTVSETSVEAVPLKSFAKTKGNSGNRKSNVKKHENVAEDLNPEKESTVLKENVVDEEETGKEPLKACNKSTGSWLQKASWTQLVSDKNTSSFSITQLFPDLNSDKGEAARVNNNVEGQSTNSDQSASAMKQTEYTCSSGGFMAAGIPVENTTVRSLDENGQHLKGKNLSKDVRIGARKTIKRKVGSGETCGFMRSSASLKEWAKSKKALSEPRRKKNSEE